MGMICGQAQNTQTVKIKKKQQQSKASLIEVNETQERDDLINFADKEVPCGEKIHE